MNPLKIVKAVPKALLVGAALFSSSTSAMAQAGNLDPTFGVGGIVSIPNASTANAVAIQSDGKIVAVGQATQGFALARFNTDGSLDAAFGTGGIVFVPDGDGGPPSSVAIQQDGKIVTAAAADFNTFVFRFNADGTPDQDFGSGGRVSLGFTLDSGGGPVAVQPDGKILVVERGLTRLFPNGQFDPSFGTGGVAPQIGGGPGLAVLGNGKVLFGLAQSNADGSADLSFGVAGNAPVLGRPSALAPLSNGQFVLVGALASKPSLGIQPQGFVVVRYNGDGTIDTNFGTHGGTVTNFPGNDFSGASAVAVQSDGAIVTAGFTAVRNCVCVPQASDFALARYTADGQLDTTFGTDGLVITSFNGDSASINALAIQSDGRIVAVGRDKPASSSPNPGFILARYLSE